MAKLSKRMQWIDSNLTAGKLYSILEAISLLKELSRVKFNENVDVGIHVNIDSRKSDQTRRGSVMLPHGTGRVTRVAVFAQGSQAEVARSVGADKVGFEDLAEWIKAGNLNFDIVIATPDAMPMVGQLGQLLGPRGLMPNPKLGTVTSDVGTAVRNSKTGQIHYRADKGGMVHCILGKLDFQPQHLQDNLNALLEALKKARPSASKGVFLKAITLSSTMGPGLPIDQASLGVASYRGV